MVSAEPPVLPPRRADGHKGTFGTVLAIGGQAMPPARMIGGPALTALAALRAGAGLARLAMPEPILSDGLTIAPEATGLALPVDDRGAVLPAASAEVIDAHLGSTGCVAIGPALGVGEAQRQLVMRLVTLDDTPMVIDADAINVMAQSIDLQRDTRCPAVLTPHPGEYRRLAEALSLEHDPTDPEQRPGAAEALAQRLGCVVVLKGSRTIITDGLQTTINPTGNASLATGGSGDVLTGLIAGLIAQFHASDPGADRSLMECAVLGAWIHGAAADRWAMAHGDAGMLARDLLDLVPDVLRDLRG